MDICRAPNTINTGTTRSHAQTIAPTCIADASSIAHPLEEPTTQTDRWNNGRRTRQTPTQGETVVFCTVGAMPFLQSLSFSFALYFHAPPLSCDHRTCSMKPRLPLSVSTSASGLMRIKEIHVCAVAAGEPPVRMSRYLRCWVLPPSLLLDSPPNPQCRLFPQYHSTRGEYDAASQQDFLPGSSLLCLSLRHLNLVCSHSPIAHEISAVNPSRLLSAFSQR